MKKFLLVVAAAIIAVSASAQVRTSLKVNPSKTVENKLKVAPMGRLEGRSDVQNEIARQLGKTPVQVTAKNKAPRKSGITPKGTPEWYSMSAYVYTYYGMMYATGLADQIAYDGNDVYFKTLFPGTASELWSKGTLNEAGDEITVSTDNVGDLDYSDGTHFDLIVCEFVLDDDGYIVDTKPIVFKKDGTRIYIDDDIDNPTRYLALGVFSEGELQGYYDLSMCIELNPVEQELNQVTVPETATTTQYTYAYCDSYGGRKGSLGNVAVDGNDVYFDYLAEGYGWVKGTRDGNTVLVPSGQFIGGDNGYFTFFNCCKNFGMDEETYATTFDIVDNFTLTVDGDVYKQTYDEDTPSLLLVDGTLYDYTYDYSIEPFTGLKPAVPADPTDLYLYDYTSYYGQYYLSGSTPNVDVNNKYIDPNSMEVSIWEDGDMLTLTPDDGYYLSDEVEWMPYGWMDESNGYDLSYSSLSPFFYLYESLFNELGLQVRYTVDGVTNYSNVVYIDIDGNTRTDYIGTVATGINNVETTSSNAIYNLAGQRVSNDFKGIVIKNGKKVIK